MHEQTAGLASVGTLSDMAEGERGREEETGREGRGIEREER